MKVLEELNLPIQVKILNGKKFIFQSELNDYKLYYRSWQSNLNLIKWQKYVLFNIKKLLIWYFTSTCYILLHSHAYISGTTNDCESNLSSKQNRDSTKLQKNDVEGNIQLTPTSALKENKMSYSMRTKWVIQLLLRSNKRRRYKMLFKIAKKKKITKNYEKHFLSCNWLQIVILTLQHLLDNWGY